MPQVFNIIYLFIAVIMSLFYGFFAGRIFVINWNEFKFLQRVYQFIFNLLGGAFGFTALYYEINKMYIELSEAPRAKARGFHSSGANPAPSIPALKGGALGRRGKGDFTKMNIGDPFILVIAMLGTMGLLPMTMATLAKNIDNALWGKK